MIGAPAVMAVEVGRGSRLSASRATPPGATCAIQRPTRLTFRSSRWVPRRCDDWRDVQPLRGRCARRVRRARASGAARGSERSPPAGM